MRAFKLCMNGERKLLEIMNDLGELQAQVGGYIEPVCLFSDGDMVFLANEGGVLLDLPENPFLLGIRGDVLIVGADGEEFCSLRDDQLQCLEILFGKGGKS